MELRCSALLVVALLAALCMPSAAHRKLTLANDPCHDYPIDVHETWVIADTEVNFYQAGSPLRGPDVPLPFRRYSILINNTFPGPTLRAKVGDWIRIDVYNMLLSTAVSIHWHGIDQKGTPWADGTVMITNCAIPSQMTGGSPSFSYIWQASDAGTFWYHGHAALEHEYGVMGAIVITDDKDPHKSLYDQELPVPIIINDWWRDPNGQIALNAQYGFYASLDAGLINGYYGDGSADLPYVTTATMQQGQCYRVRFVNANGEWEGWQASIASNQTTIPMTIIAVDGNNIKPLTVDTFMFYAAERVDAVICADVSPGDYMLTFKTVENLGTCAYINGCQNVTSSIISITPGSSATSSVDRQTIAGFPKMSVFDIMKDYRMIKPLVVKPLPTTKHMRWTMKLGFTFTAAFFWTDTTGTSLPTAPYLFTKGKCGVKANTNTKTVPELGTVVDIVVNNLNNGLHVVHIHGHDFWVLGSGYFGPAGNPLPEQNQTLCPGASEAVIPGVPGFWGCPYSPKRDRAGLNLVDPYITDSVPLPAMGWVYLRIKLDNPGVWFAHCHLNNHMVFGMGFLLNVAPSKQPAIPAWVDTACGGACANAAAQECGPFSPPPSTKQPKCVSNSKGGAGYCTGDTPAAFATDMGM